MQFTDLSTVMIASNFSICFFCWLSSIEPVLSFPFAGDGLYCLIHEYRVLLGIPVSEHRDVTDYPL